ncbi:RNA polymerase II transcription factor B 52 kDa subunit [Apiotrichum porosum]|uniref:RNA polymerase II transcription factor B subunit 2 n=1 Tax=Apiotrichum porosum TaxID=105984 RepID=A0A427XX92_9TREE|nr:RNA polymerase II transcription factor B 52 kDa subunit [Apiotrichum porosum]RSH83453.1 RNA polymerase II transcription factor B 52 kDa subunit [Apiotrichum porosum]
MVLPSFSNPGAGPADAVVAASPTAPLDAFLDNQPQTFYESIYRSEAACLCILRLLPPVCRQIVLHVLWSHQTLKSADLKAFCGMDERLAPDAAEEVIRPARDRHIFLSLNHKGNKFQWPLSDTFKRGLRNALTGLGTSNSFGAPYARGPRDEVPTAEALTDYGEDTWESILKYMVSSGLTNGYRGGRPRNSVLLLLYQSGLMADPYDRSGHNPKLEALTITSKGFQFLLEDRQTQLWQILMYYLAGKQARGENAADILSLFFSLGCMQLGQDYSASESFPHMENVLDDLEQYGFVYRTEMGRERGQFFPTHLSTTLCSGESGASRSQSADDKRFLILETNYKIYAYTSNDLEIAILNLFVNIRIRYPNLVVGRLDRRHVKAAMDKGIAAGQIISYLNSHAHPQMYNHPPPILHPSVTDQLHLWDKERNRLGAQESVMFEFFSRELFDETRDEAERNAGLHLALPAKKLLFVDPNVREAIKDFIKDKQVQLRGGI